MLLCLVLRSMVYEKEVYAEVSARDETRKSEEEETRIKGAILTAAYEQLERNVLETV